MIKWSCWRLVMGSQRFHEIDKTDLCDLCITGRINQDEFRRFMTIVTIDERGREHNRYLGARLFKRHQVIETVLPLTSLTAIPF
jgi:hypothetical protein